MAGNYEQLKDLFNNPTQHGIPAWDNNENLLSGLNIKSYFLSIINSLTAGYQFMGVATSETEGGTPDQNVFYLAGAGTYTGFGSNPITIDAGYIGIIRWNGAWSSESIKIADVVSVSQNILAIGNEPKCGVASLENDFTTRESIEIYSDDDELVHKIDEEHANFKNLQSNGENVNAIPQLGKSQSFNGKGILITKDDNTFLLRFDEFGLCVDGLYNSQGKKYLVNPITNIPITIVDANGGGNYTTIQDAIDNTQDGDVILIMSGTYNEAVKMFGKNRHLVGINKETVILTNSTGLRATPPLEANIGSVENITIYAAAGTVTEDDEVGKSYGVHIEAGYTSPYSLTFRNCKIGSRLQAGIGLGLRWNQTVIVENCEIYSEASKSWSTALEEFQDTGGFFFHNDATVSNKPGGKLIIKDCLIHGVKAALAGGSVDNGSVCSLASINNTLYSETYGVSSDTFLAMSTPISGMLVGECIELSILSHGNNNNDINYN